MKTNTTKTWIHRVNVRACKGLGDIRREIKAHIRVTERLVRFVEANNIVKGIDELSLSRRMLRASGWSAVAIGIRAVEVFANCVRQIRSAGCSAPCALVHRF